MKSRCDSPSLSFHLHSPSSLSNSRYWLTSKQVTKLAEVDWAFVPTLNKPIPFFLAFRALSLLIPLVLHQLFPSPYLSWSRSSLRAKLPSDCRIFHIARILSFLYMVELLSNPVVFHPTLRRSFVPRLFTPHHQRAHNPESDWGAQINSQAIDILKGLLDISRRTFAQAVLLCRNYPAQQYWCATPTIYSKSTEPNSSGSSFAVSCLSADTIQ